MLEGHGFSDDFHGLIERARFLAERSAQHDFFNAIVRSILQTASFTTIELLAHRIDDLGESELPSAARQLLHPTDGDTQRLISIAIPLLSEANLDITSSWFTPSAMGTSLCERVNDWCRYRVRRSPVGTIATQVVGSNPFLTMSSARLRNLRPCCLASSV